MTDPKARDLEHNIDGTETDEGKCYRSDACIDNGTPGAFFLTISVSEITGEEGDEHFLKRLHKKGMLEKALDIVGIDVKGLESALGELSTYPWLREEGVLDPIHNIFGYPEGTRTRNNSEKLMSTRKLLQKITKWRPEKRSLQIGKQFIVSEVWYSTTTKDKEVFCNQLIAMDIKVFGPDWENEGDKDGFSTKEEAITFGKEKVYQNDAFPCYARTDGPWDSRVMSANLEKDEDNDEGSDEEDDIECRIEVMTKEQFACFLHNLMVHAGHLNAPLYMPPYDATTWFAIGGMQVQLRPLPERLSKAEEEDMIRTKHHYMVLKLRYPTGMARNMVWMRRVDEDLYGPKGKDNKADHDGFLTKEEAVKYAKEEVRDKCEWFTDYTHFCANNAKSDGPWDSAEMGNPDNDEEVRVEVLTREEFACFQHNMMIASGLMQGRMIPSPPVPISLSNLMGRL